MVRLLSGCVSQAFKSRTCIFSFAIHASLVLSSITINNKHQNTYKQAKP